MRITCTQSTVTSHDRIPYSEQLLPQRMLIASDKLIGIKTPFSKENRKPYMEPETETQTANGWPPAALATVGIWNASR